MRLEIAQLGELLVAVVQLASEGFCGCMYDLVCPDVAMLGESFAANVAVIRTLAGVPSFVRLEIS